MLASKESQALSQKVNTELTVPENMTSNNLIDYLESKLFQNQTERSNSAIICISTFGCFCWAGWNGPSCTQG
jgi:hypothetical protein